MVNVAKNLIAAREAAGKTQAEVSEAVGISVSTLSNYEQGTRIPRDEIKIKLAQYFKKSIEDLFYT